MRMFKVTTGTKPDMFIVGVRWATNNPQVSYRAFQKAIDAPFLGSSKNIAGNLDDITKPYEGNAGYAFAWLGTEQDPV